MTLPPLSPSFQGILLSYIISSHHTKHHQKHHLQKISLAKMHMFRWMCSNTRRDKVKNENIRTKVDIALIKEKMRENRLQ